MIRSTHVLIVLGAFSLVGVAHAQDAILWKSSSKLTPSVVPPYNGEASPFPTKTSSSSKTSETTALEEEAARLRNAAFEQAQAVIASGRGVEPYMAGIRVEGMLEGIKGRKVLVSNRWLGVGSVIPVRVTRSAEVAEAIKALTTYDSTAGLDLNSRLDKEIANNPTTPLTLREIRKDSLVFDSKYGREVVEFKLNLK